MPVYTYRAIADPNNKKAHTCEMCEQPFELIQRMVEDALTSCPTCGRAIERVVSAPNLNGVGRIQKPSDAQLARSGFTQYKKAGKGHYEKTFGTGPSTLNP
jgi:putative FmdB family regulatory protein